MATTVGRPDVVAARTGHREEPASTAGRPVLWWALIGTAFLAFSAYLIVAWVLGPYFTEVPSGPDDPPGWMRAVQLTWTAIGIPGAAFLLYRVLVRPWRREGRPSTDGLMAVACLLLVVQDPWSSYFQHWFTYNASLPNRGSWVNEIPGWMAYGKPGAQVPEPILWSPFMYCYAFFIITVLGCKVMRAAKRRWPQLGPLRLFAVAAVGGMLLDVVLEGLLFLPLGFYSYAGGHWALFPHAYHKFPLHEAVFAGTMFGAMSSVRYFIDDRGRSLAERGVDELRVGVMRQSGLRFLAIFGVFSVIVLACYNIPTAVMAANSTAWPADVQKRSYFLDRVCGQGTGRPCPAPGVPLYRPGEAPPQRIVPFDSRDSGPFNGGPF